MASPDLADYLLSLPSIRQRAHLLAPALHSNTLQHFDVSLANLESRVLPAVLESIRTYSGSKPPSSIPSHGRWQHFASGNVPRLDKLIAEWESSGVDRLERLKRVIDLTVISVLLDAGAGNDWTFSEDGKTYTRSEGLAVASLHMFSSGLFSSDADQPYLVDAEGLRRLTPEKLAKGLQVSDSNPVAGLEGRAKLLHDVAPALQNSALFGEEYRPGGMINYLLTASAGADSKHPHVVPVERLWTVLTQGFGSIWPVRTQIGGRNIGDAWHYPPLSQVDPSKEETGELAGTEAQDVLPFHKLTQWLCYSLLIPFKKVLDARTEGEELLTGLPEYRNGGLFVDYGVLSLKTNDAERGFATARAEDDAADDDEIVPLFEAKDEVIVEWRALTIVLLDMLLPMVNESLGLHREAEQLNLAQMLEAGSWAAGRQVAAQRRSKRRGPPIATISDGTVF